MRQVVSIGASAAALLTSAPATAVSISFDCDVPENRFSAVTIASTGPAPFVRGVVSLKGRRLGSYQPVAGARLVTDDGNWRFGVQLALESADKAGYSVYVNSKQGNNVVRQLIGTVGVAEKLPFAVAVDADGRGTVTVGTLTRSVGLIPVKTSKAMIFCSTGQFLIDDVMVSTPSK